MYSKQLLFRNKITSFSKGLKEKNYILYELNVLIILNIKHSLKHVSGYMFQFITL